MGHTTLELKNFDSIVDDDKMGKQDDEDIDWDLIPDSAPVKFDSAEHADIPAECYIPFSTNRDNDLSGRSEEGTLKVQKKPGKNDVNITFAKAIAYVGEFFVNKPIPNIISYGDTFGTRKNRFTGSVEDLKGDPNNHLRDGLLGKKNPGLESYLSSEWTGIERFILASPTRKSEHAENIGSHNLAQMWNHAEAPPKIQRQKKARGSRSVR